MLSEGQFVQLSVAAVFAIVLFVLAYGLPQKAATIGLIILIPFQPIQTQYATANVLLTFVVFIAMLMRRERVHLPLLPHILVLMFVYLVSMSRVHPSIFSFHAFYMFWILSAVLVFWLAYDLTQRFADLRGMVNVFVAINVLVFVYSVVQLWRGFDEPLTFFGFDEISMEPVRIEDGRITGPFGGSGIVAEYFVTSIYLLLYQLLSSTQPRHRLFFGLLAMANFALLVATQSRGGFLTFVGAGAIFLWMFRKELGVVRIVGLVSGGVMALALAAALIVNYTEFGGLFDRLAETEVQGGIPDTRLKAWPAAWQEIKKKPLLGHGPQMRLPDDDVKRYKGHVYIMYPHNLYLFLLFTVGVAGLLAFMTFFLTPMRRCWQVGFQPGVDPYTAGLAKTGVVILAAILIDQIKVEFLRGNMTDYWHYVFALLGMMVAVCDRGRGFNREQSQR